MRTEAILLLLIVALLVTAAAAAAVWTVPLPGGCTYPVLCVDPPGECVALVCSAGSCDIDRPADGVVTEAWCCDVSPCVRLEIWCNPPGPCPLSARGHLRWTWPPGGCLYTVACTPEHGCLPDSYPYTACDPDDPATCKQVQPDFSVAQKLVAWASAVEIYCCQESACGEPVVMVVEDWPVYCDDEFRTCCAGGACG